jgi:uncharacterized protein YjeT (DUF2065 family)
MSEVLLTALAMVLVFEGLTYALVPGQLKRTMARMTDVPEEKLRVGGLMAMALGVFLVWLVRSLFQV